METTIRGSTRRSLIFQGVLILMPVLVLAWLGFRTLRKDRALLDHEARAQAERVAVEALDHLQAILTSAGSNQPAFVAIDGELLLPRPFESRPLPQPWADARALADPQDSLWRVADASRDPQAWEEFLAVNPPAPWAESARYRMGLLLADLGEHEAARAAFDRVGVDDAEALSEAGLPLVPLARWKSLEIVDLMNGSFSREELQRTLELALSEAVAQPSALTEPLLARLTAQAARWDMQAIADSWIQRWHQEQLARGLHARAAASLVDPWPALFELTGPDHWLLARQTTDRNRFAAFPIGRNRPLAEQEDSPVAMALGRVQVPPHLALQLEVADGVAIGASQAGDSVALAVETRGQPTETHLRATVALADPATFYARQRQRSVWFGALVFVAALVAVAGYLLARKSLVRQLALNEMQANFISSVSHELRSPIAALRLMAESIARGSIADPARQHEYFRLMVQECRRLAGMIENVLTLARTDRNAQTYEPEPTDLARLIRETTDLLEPVATDRGVKLCAHAPPNGLPQPSLDGRALQQAVINLIDNAIKHSPDGGIVTVGLEQTGGKIQLWVRDRGPGIPPEDHQRIFDRFYRRGSELRRETPGIGIGLSIVKRIVEDMGGRVWVQSQTGDGSKFIIELCAAVNPWNES